MFGDCCRPKGMNRVSLLSAQAMVVDGYWLSKCTPSPPQTHHLDSWGGGGSSSLHFVQGFLEGLREDALLQ